LKIVDLPPSNLYILQGEDLENTLSDLPESVRWVNWKDKILYSEQKLIEKNFQGFLSKLETKKILNPSQVNNLRSMSNILALTERFSRELPNVINSYRIYEDFFSFLKLYSEQIELTQELKWARYFETQSKTSVSLKRLEKLNDEISQLEKRKRTIEPQYIFLKEQQDQYKKSLKSLNDKVKEINKLFITKTRQINKLKRQIDAEKPKNDLYTEKIAEITSTVNSLDLPKDENYIRISRKLQNVNEKIARYKQEILTISEISSQLKSELKDLKNKLRQLKENHSQASNTYTAIETEYLEILNTLNQKEREKSDLIKYQSMENTSQNMGEPPSNIRFSSIIEDDLRSNSIKLSKYISNQDISWQEYIDQFFDSWSIPKSIFQDPEPTIQSHPEEIIPYFQKIVKNIENEMRSVLKPLNLKITFLNLPLVSQDHSIVPELGIQYMIFKNKKTISLEKLATEERLYFKVAFNYSINKICGITSHIFRDTDFKIKRTKKLFENVIQLIKKGILSKNPGHTILFLISKPILENTKQKDMVITTILKN
jgi:hypothetical protein